MTVQFLKDNSGYKLEGKEYIPNREGDHNFKIRGYSKLLKEIDGKSLKDLKDSGVFFTVPSLKVIS